jgi:hypothetical protein
MKISRLNWISIAVAVSAVGLAAWFYPSYLIQYPHTGMPTV